MDNSREEMVPSVADEARSVSGPTEYHWEDPVPPASQEGTEKVHPGDSKTPVFESR